MPEAPLDLPARSGPRPSTTDTSPHTQLDQNPPREVYDELANRMPDLPGSHEEASKISVIGARALILDHDVEPGPREAFMIDAEFCHLHPPHDASLHMGLPLPVAAHAREQGWAENHPLAMSGRIPENIHMVYAPRDSDEVEIVLRLVAASNKFARGLW